MPISQKLLRKLYIVDHQSMAEIAVMLGCSLHKVNYWMQMYSIARRNRSDANYAKYNPSGDPFSIINIDNIEKARLYSLAIGLYWGEGNKRNRNSVRIGNSDPYLLKQWVKFLRTICQISDNKIHYHLQTFKDINTGIALEFWSKELATPTDKITTCKPIPSMGKGNYKKLSQYGVMTIGAYNIRFREWLMEQLKQLGYNPNL